MDTEFSTSSVSGTAFNALPDSIRTHIRYLEKIIRQQQRL